MDFYGGFVKAAGLADSGRKRRLLDHWGPNGYFTYMTVVRLGNDILRQKALPVEEITDEIRELAREMLVTMEESDGVGLAAPQIGKSIRMFVVKADDGIERPLVRRFRR